MGTARCGGDVWLQPELSGHVGMPVPHQAEHTWYPLLPLQIAMLRATLAKKKKRSGPGKMFKKVGRAGAVRGCARLCMQALRRRDAAPALASFTPLVPGAALPPQLRLAVSPSSSSPPRLQAAEAIRQGLSPDKQPGAEHQQPLPHFGAPTSGAAKTWGSFKSKIGGLARGGSREEPAAGMFPPR